MRKKKARIVNFSDTKGVPVIAAFLHQGQWYVVQNARGSKRSSDHKKHAEYLLIQKAKELGIVPDTILVSIHPCEDCYSSLTEFGVKKILFLGNPKNKNHLNFRTSGTKCYRVNEFPKEICGLAYEYVIRFIDMLCSVNHKPSTFRMLEKVKDPAKLLPHALRGQAKSMLEEFLVKYHSSSVIIEAEGTKLLNKQITG